MIVSKHYQTGSVTLHIVLVLTLQTPNPPRRNQVYEVTGDVGISVSRAAGATNAMSLHARSLRLVFYAPISCERSTFRQLIWLLWKLFSFLRCDAKIENVAKIVAGKMWLTALSPRFGTAFVYAV